MCLPLSLTKRNQNFTSKGLYIAGFGETEKGKASDVKIVAKVFGVDDASCAALHRWKSMGNRMCAVGPEGVDACKGKQNLLKMNQFLNDLTIHYYC